MGTSNSCCCQKLCMESDSSCPIVLNTAGKDNPDEPIASTSDWEERCKVRRDKLGVPLAAVLSEGGTENHRNARKRGNSTRIGQKSGNFDDEAEGLLQHKRTRHKGRETVKLIKRAMHKDRICALLEETEIETILETMEYFVFSAGEPVVEQGNVGTTFFVTHCGTMEVTVNDAVCNTMRQNDAFGGLALLYHCPRTATVTALDDVGVWGANGATFHRVLQENAQRHYRENRNFLECIRIFDGLAGKQKDKVAALFFAEVYESDARVLTQGHTVTAIYFVKKGELKAVTDGVVNANGELEGGEESARLRSGECFGDSALFDSTPQAFSVVSVGRCELLCISVVDLKEVLGSDLKACLERNLVLQGLKMSPIISQFSLAQQLAIVKAMRIRHCAPGEPLREGVRCAVIIDGSISGTDRKEQLVTYTRGQWYDDGSLMDLSADNPTTAGGKDPDRMADLAAGPQGARLCTLSRHGLGNALKELGLSAIGSAEQAVDLTRKFVLAKKVHIFRHLSPDQVNNLVKSFVLQVYTHGAQVIKQGEIGSAFFVISSGEVKVSIDSKEIRTMGKNSYFGERALLFDEPRTASVEVTSSECELWSIEKRTFSMIVKGNMQAALMQRISLQDTSVNLKDVRHIRTIGAGAAGIVRLVQHKKTQVRYALKRVKKHHGKIPDEVQRECDLLAQNDHPFIMALVKTFETPKYVYILTELITGGELHAAIRTIPTVLSRPQAQFYTGSLVIVLEELSDRNIVYRDLKPENVMLDAQGYLKLIDFGIAKKLEEGKSRTFTMIGTPHYMAPEVMRGHGYSTEVDLWSLGVMLFELVCGYLPFADELDDPTEVCTAVLKHNLTFPSRYRDQHGRALMQGLLCRQPKKRCGSGIHGFEDVKNAEYFKVGHQGGDLFNKIMGRELDPPVTPKGETYCAEDDQNDPSDLEDMGGS